MDALVPAYEKLLQDPEAKVRTAATFNLSEVAGTGAEVRPSAGQQAGGRRVPMARRLVERVVSLTEDDSENVRAALAMVATDLAPALGRDATIEHLLPPMLLLLRDSTSEFRLNIVFCSSSFCLAAACLPPFPRAASDGQWPLATISVVWWG